jgi:hypothetical protein
MLRDRFACGLLAATLLTLLSTYCAAGELWVCQKTAPAAATPGSPDSPAYTVANPPGRHPYYFVPQRVEVYPWYGGVPSFHWGYFGATRHSQCVGPQTGYYNDYYQFSVRRGD